MAFALLAENRYGYQENHTDKLEAKSRTRTVKRLIWRYDMTREEAIWYLTPIAESASLERYKEALSMAVAALREQEERRWIPVAERLPELIPCRAGTAYSEAVNVLTSDRKVITAIWDGTDWIGPFRFWDAEGEEITHWTPVLLPLPEPPKPLKEAF